MTRNLTEVLCSIVPETTFDCRRLGVLGWEDFRSAYQRSTDLEHVMVGSAKPSAPSELLTELTDVLRTLLSEYLVDDRFGNRLAHIFGGIPKIDVEEFAVNTVRAAAALEAARVGDWIKNWANGETIPYTIHAVISGVTTEHPLKMEEGIRFRTLENLSDVRFPEGYTFNIGPSRILGGLMVDIDCETGPALCRPEEIEDIPYRSWGYGAMSTDPITTLCEALSLVCNCYVSFVISWLGCSEEMKALRLDAGPGYSWNATDSLLPSVNLSPENLLKVSDCIVKINAISGKRQDLIRAINRWMRSKRGLGDTDQFIELRIALEVLYLKTNRDELGFRLANYGAWHLGNSFSERKDYREVLRQAYREASTAVHTAGVKDKGENRKLLSQAQDLCRMGILKRLDETEEPNWDDLILGGPAD